MKIAVIGSRNITHIDWTRVRASDGDIIISGGARGVDSLAAAHSYVNNLRLMEIRPDYSRFGRGAPIVRNRLIVDAADRVVAFWDGKSKGTLFTINHARKCGKEVEVVNC